MYSENNQKMTESIKVAKQSQRPGVTSRMAAMLVSKIYGLVPDKVKELDSYDDRNFHIKVSLEHTNPYVKDVCTHGYVVKVINCVESKTNSVEAEFAAQHQLTESGINCPLVVPSCDGHMYQCVHLSDFADATSKVEANRDPDCLNQVRLMEFVPGVPFNTVPYTPHLLANAGAFLGRIHGTLQDFSDPHLTEGHPLWALNNVSAARPFLSAVTDVTRRNLAEDVITSCHQVLTNAPQLPKGTIHGDFNDSNILVTQHATKADDITGIIDFAHLANSYYIYDLGVSIMYLSVSSCSVAPLMVGGYFLSGYLHQRPLVATEWQLLKYCVCARYAQSLVIGAYHCQCEPDNKYLSQTSVRGWEQLTVMWHTPQEQLYQMWCDIIRDCGTDVELPY